MQPDCLKTFTDRLGNISGYGNFTARINKDTLTKKEMKKSLPHQYTIFIILGLQTIVAKNITVAKIEILHQ